MVTKQRDSNLELYRIIVMILIVAHHYVVHSDLFDMMRQSPITSKSLYLFLFGMWGKTGINCFVLITGYFMCQSRITLRKFTKLVFWALFYKIVIYLIFSACGYVDFSLKSLLSNLLIIRDIKAEFTSCFLVFFLNIPFLNILVKNMDKKQHTLLLLLSLFVYSIWSQIPHILVSINYVIWFCVLYILASYIRKYNVFEHIDHKKWGWLTLCSIIVSVLSVLIMRYAGHYPYYFVSDSNAVLAVVVSVCTFMFFKTYPLKYHKWINTVGASTFGVLLIHDNSDLMRQWLWKDTLNNVGFYANNIYLHSIISVLGVFCICTLIDQLRLRYIEKPLFKVLDAYMVKRGNKFFFRWI